MSEEITFFGFEREADRYEDWASCLREFLDSGMLHSSGSSFTTRLESEFAAWLGRRHAVAVSSGTEALRLGLEVLALPPGEVIVPAFTFQACAAGIVRNGLTPRFVDIDPISLQLDPAAVARAVTERTVGILPVHLFGIPAPVDRLKQIADQHGVPVLEDCAQAVGAAVGQDKVGTFGTVAAFSCGPTKPLGGLGEGGIIVTDEESHDAYLRRARHNGALRDFRHELVGANAMMDSLQSAFLLHRLSELDEQLDARRAIVERYRRVIGEEPAVTIVGASRDDMLAAPSKFTVLLSGALDRDGVVTMLADRGVPANLFYRTPLHRQECFRGKAEAEDLPVTDDVAARVLSLPLHPFLSEHQVDWLAEQFVLTVRKAMDR